MGHTKVKCKKPIAPEDDNGGDAGYGGADAGYGGDGGFSGGAGGYGGGASGDDNWGPSGVVAGGVATSGW